MALNLKMKTAYFKTILFKIIFLPKIYKTGGSMRPIVSAVGTPNTSLKFNDSLTIVSLQDGEILDEFWVR